MSVKTVTFSGQRPLPSIRSSMRLPIGVHWTC